jgi:hypothetical protein
MVLLDRLSSVRKRRLIWAATIGGLVLVPIGIAAYLAPVQLARHVPSGSSLLRLRTWLFYWKALPEMLSPVMMGAAAIGLVVAARTVTFRGEAAFLALWIAALILSFTPLPARDPRYILLVAPAIVLAAAAGVAGLLETRVPPPGTQVASLAVMLVAAAWSSTRTDVPIVDGFRDAAVYIHQHAGADPVLYDGRHDGLLMFYARAMDPHFQSRFVVAQKLLYEFGPATTFRPIETPKVTSPSDIVEAIRTRCGCPWIAVEIGPAAMRIGTQRLLRATLVGDAFVLERSFPIRAEGVDRLDLYRARFHVAPVDTVDLSFRAFTTRTFEHVRPITR